jgi:nitroimidazol reductase NimA-like FMN-containing flavoprotein (pyridoxamine 5'-phosphate oxidase superfamily)
MLDKMKALVKEKDICVLGTVSGNKPYCSLMAYVADDTCLELYMATHKDTTKYKNLLANPAVSLLIDTRDEDAGPQRLQAKALTVNGVFDAIRDEHRKEVIRGKLLQRHPHLMGFMSDPGVEVFAVKVESFLLLVGLTDAYFETVA